MQLFDVNSDVKRTENKVGATSHPENFLLVEEGDGAAGNKLSHSYWEEEEDHGALKHCAHYHL